MASFFAWMAGLIAGMKDQWQRSKDKADRRQDAVTHQWSKLNDVLIGQVKENSSQIKDLFQQNADQAAQMNTQRRQIAECQEHHKECERDRNRLAAQVAAVTTKVDKIETKLLPEPK